MKVAIACDHAALNLKNNLIKHLIADGYDVTDFGIYVEGAVDYPDYAIKVAESVASGETDKGILICGTGIGMSIAANKHNGIRAACCSDVFSARLTREHNDANILCFGARVVGEGLALDLVDAFLNAKYLGNGNHVTRVAMLADIENEKF
jgi:ribose 5-phosphate isomerase B